MSNAVNRKPRELRGPNSRRRAAPGMLDRSVKCRFCEATFIPDLYDFYRKKHERVFHGGEYDERN